MASKYMTNVELSELIAGLADSIIAGIDFIGSVNEIYTDELPPVDPDDNDRIIFNNASPSGWDIDTNRDGTGDGVQPNDGDVLEYNSSTSLWERLVNVTEVDADGNKKAEGAFTWVEYDDRFVVYNGTSWVDFFGLEHLKDGSNDGSILSRNNYSDSFGALEASGLFSVSLGDQTTVQSDHSTITGGHTNSITGTDSEKSFIGSGSHNNINGIGFSTIISGSNNTITRISGGADINYSGIVAGYNNSITSDAANQGKNIIAGGEYNELEYVNFSGVFAGQSNKIIGVSGDNNSSGSAILSGSNNEIDENLTGTIGSYSSIVSGESNLIHGDVDTSLICAGWSNKIEKTDLSVQLTDKNIIGAGQNNLIQNAYQCGILSGSSNKIYGSATTSNSTFNCAIVSGAGNQISSDGATQSTFNSAILTGDNNTINSGISYSAIIAGFDNELSGDTDFSAIISGNSNLIDTTSNYNFIGSGLSNSIELDGGDFPSGYASIVGGGSNKIYSRDDYDFIGGGSMNVIRNQGYSAIIGGSGNQILSGDLDSADGVPGTSFYNGIVTGQGNKIYKGAGSNIVIAGGNSNIIEGNNVAISIPSTESGILSGYLNTITSTQRSAILSGSNNTITSSITARTGNSIVAGTSNTITNSISCFIGAGNSNQIAASSFSGILAGQNNNIPSFNDTFIIGSGITASAENTTYVENLNADSLQLRDNTAQAGGNYTGFQAPASLSSNIIYTLPSSDGTNGQVLMTNGSLSLSWYTLDNVITDHGSLTGLGNDDHTQYALLNGRSSGQTLIGGTAASGNLTLQSTSNATKGNVISIDNFVIGGGTSPSEIRLLEGSGSGTNYTAFKSPTALVSNITYTLPGNAGTNGQVLSTDGTGTLTWEDMAPGSVTSSSTSIDNEIVRFDGATGTIIQSSPIAITDDGLFGFKNTVTSAGIIHAEIATGSASDMLIQAQSSPDASGGDLTIKAGNGGPTSPSGNLIFEGADAFGVSGGGSIIFKTGSGISNDNLRLTVARFSNIIHTQNEYRTESGTKHIRLRAPKSTESSPDGFDKITYILPPRIGHESGAGIYSPTGNNYFLEASNAYNIGSESTSELRFTLLSDYAGTKINIAVSTGSTNLDVNNDASPDAAYYVSRTGTVRLSGRLLVELANNTAPLLIATSVPIPEQEGGVFFVCAAQSRSDSPGAGDDMDFSFDTGIAGGGTASGNTAIWMGFLHIDTSGNMYYGSTANAWNDTALPVIISLDGISYEKQK